MMTILTATRWNAFLDCACLTKSCGLLPHNPPWESFFFGAPSHINDHHMDDKPKHMFSLGWLILNLHTISSFFILLMSWRYTRELTQTLSSRHTYHLIFVNSSYCNLHISMITIWMTSPSTWSHWDGSSWTCTPFLLSSSCWCLEDTLERSPNLLLQDILITWSSSHSSIFNLEANIWFKHCLWTIPTNITQCKH